MLATLLDVLKDQKRHKLTWTQYRVKRSSRKTSEPVVSVASQDSINDSSLTSLKSLLCQCHKLVHLIRDRANISSDKRHPDGLGDFRCYCSAPALHPHFLLAVRSSADSHCCSQLILTIKITVAPG